MFEKVNPSHPDKIADRIAGALVDYAYAQEENPKIAVEVLIGHGKCYIIAETSVKIPKEYVLMTVYRISGDNKIMVMYDEHDQDKKLADNQQGKLRCGDNGIFKGVPVSWEEKTLSYIARKIYDKYHSDGKYIYDEDDVELIICQSNVTNIRELEAHIESVSFQTVNPLGNWTGGLNVDTGAVNRKLGSDMGAAVTGGGIHGKDLSKADVAVNIYAFLKAQETGDIVELKCAIGDDMIDNKPYNEIVEIAREYIRKVGGFEKFAEWGFI